MKKNAIFVVSFGTSYPDALKNSIESTEKLIYKVFRGYEPRRAFTSELIIRKLKKRDNIHIDGPAEALQKLAIKGYSRIVVQPLHIIPGYEYHQVKQAVDEFRRKKVFEEIFLGEPLLFNSEDYKAVTEFLKVNLAGMSRDEGAVLMGHGTAHFSNACYYCLQSYMEKAGLRAYLANVEGCPTLEDVMDRLREKSISKIILMPFMLVAGDHARNDMAGSEDSWKTILEKEGFQVKTFMHGLAESDAVRNMFAKKALKAHSSFGQQ